MAFELSINPFILVLLNVDFDNADNAAHVEAQVNAIKRAVANGAIGLKVYKGLGLTNKDSKGK